MALDGGGQLADALVNAAQAEAVAAGIGFDAGAGAGLAQREQEVVEFGVLVLNHDGDEAEGIAAGGSFVGRDVADIREMASSDGAGQILGMVGVVFVDGEVGQMALLLFAGHEGQDSVADLAAVEHGLAGLVEILGGGAEVFVE